MKKDLKDKRKGLITFIAIVIAAIIDELTGTGLLKALLSALDGG